jgi:hypothetical protein
MTVRVRFDHDRAARIGLPEAVLCEGKTDEQLWAVATALHERPPAPALFTRMAGDQRVVVERAAGCELDFDSESGTAFLHGRRPARSGSVTVVTAGTSDLRVAREASRTLEFLGIAANCIADVGVAGLWRLEARLDEIRAADIVIAVAGMDAALASVLGGLVAAPVIGVPTSSGYGVARDGQTALHSMLCSCAQGVVVANIDNGFGAACAAARILAIVP